MGVIISRSILNGLAQMPVYSKYVLFFLVLALCCPAIGAAQEEPDESAEQGIVEESAPAPKLKTPNFGRFKRQFSQICDAVNEDLRREKLYELLFSISERNEECVACRPLINTFAAACKPAVVKQKKEKKKPEAQADAESEDEKSTQEETTESPTPTPSLRTKQREPHAAVIALVSELFQEIAASEENQTEVVKAVDVLARALSGHPSFSAAERGYFSIIAEYLKAPFEAMPRESATPTDHKKTPEKQEDNVDDLFGE